MKKQFARAVVVATAGVALASLTGGVAQAEPTPVYVLPGVDAGALLGPTAQVPQQALQPVFGALPGGGQGAVPGVPGLPELPGAVPGLPGLPGTQAAAPAAAPADEHGGVAIVDEPDTSGLNNKWTFAPAGVPVLGFIDSVQGVPKRIS